MSHFADRLCQAIQEKRSCVVVGLDPRPEQLPPEFQPSPGASAEEVAERFRLFHRQVVEVVTPHAVAVKPQIAFFEPYGPAGIAAYLDAIAFARGRGLLVIGDVKRNDIGSTAEAYAAAHLGPDGADAVTVNPYLGSDGLKPFIQVAARNGKGVFVLVKTSNPSASEIQDLLVDGEPVYVWVARLARGLGEAHVGRSGYSLVGAVVGATQAASARTLRREMPRALFLVPGYGAQGGAAADCAPCFNPDGLGAVVNSSRGILFAYAEPAWRQRFSPEDWRAATEAAVTEMRRQIEQVRSAQG
jgi:orotidine-5'-phosphate decarboxylase